MRTGQRPTRACVIELAVHPVDGVMAGFTRRREVRRNVINRRLGVVVVRLVTRDACRYRDVVVTVDMAILAGSWRDGMRACKCPTSLRVIELAIHPVDGVMAGFAGERELRAHVIDRRLGVVVVRLVARDATGLRNVVVAVDVAIGTRARRYGVRSRQCPAGLRVIKLAVHPVNVVVAGFAGERELCAHVIDRSLGVVVVRLVARNAAGLRNVVVAVDVAIATSARRHGMRSRQCPPRLRVIKLAVHPVHGVVAGIAGGWELRAHVIDRSLGVVVIGLVARYASRLGQVVIAVDVAIRALSWRHGMRARQWPTGSGMIELAIHPVHRVVAPFAIRRELRVHVVDRGLGVVVVGLVA